MKKNKIISFSARLRKEIEAGRRPHRYSLHRARVILFPTPKIVSL
jgi:hypothetical protein